MSELEALCRAYTDLSEGEIFHLKEIEKQLPLMAELANADIFLDCQLDKKTAMVVAHAWPERRGSAYEETAVGKTACPEREPAVFHAFQLGMAVCDLKAITQENRSVKQNAAVIRSDSGRIIGVLVREKDISTSVRQEKKYEKLAKSYEDALPELRAIEAEKEQQAVALREVHHRIKNNLQLVASILNIQARNSKNGEVRQILEENVSRVLSIAAIHDILLHKDEDISSVNSSELLERLRWNLQTLAPADQEIQLVISGDNVVLSADTASSVAMVVAELVSNTYRHAFPGRKSGRVEISVCEGNLFHIITVRDNGVGFEPAKRRRDSLGLSIAEATVRDKLKGKLRISSGSDGTKVSFDFKRE